MPRCPRSSPWLAVWSVIVIWNVQRDDWRAFGASVALERFNAELVPEGLPKLIVECVTACGDMAQMPKLIRRDMIDDGAEKLRISGNQSDALIASDPAKFVGVEKGYGVYRACTCECRQDQRRAEPNRICKWQ
jgi:hypothetical protein